MRQRLLHELFAVWLSEQLQQLNSVRPALKPLLPDELHQTCPSGISY